MTEAEALEHARTELLEQYIGAGNQPEERGAPALLLEIEAGAPLVAVEREEHRRGSAGERRHRAFAGERRHPAQVVPALGVLDLVDARAEVREHQRCERPRKQPAQIEDPEPRERARLVAQTGAAPPPRSTPGRNRIGSIVAHFKLKSFWSFIASIWLPVTFSLPAKNSCIPLACGFSTSF